MEYPFESINLSLRVSVVFRDYIFSTYQELKKANPTFPVLVRECSGVEAKLIARYGRPYSWPCTSPFIVLRAFTEVNAFAIAGVQILGKRNLCQSRA